MHQLPETALLRSFVTVTQELSFRRAADRLALDQSALSRRIQKLEAELGYPLFERTTREVALTPAGQDFYRSVSRILLDCSRSIDEARRVALGHTGRLRVGYMAFAATDLMPRTVARFRDRHPGITLELRFMRTQMQKIAIANDEIDVGFLIGPYDNRDCHSLTLALDPLHVVTPQRHRLLHQPTVQPADIANEPLILGNMAEWGEYRFRLEDQFGRLGISLEPALEASTTLALIGLVAAGLGITVYPESLIGFLGRNVEARPIIHPDLHSRTVLVWKRSNRARAVLNFIETARNRGPA